MGCGTMGLYRREGLDKITLIFLLLFSLFGKKNYCFFGMNMILQVQQFKRVATLELVRSLPCHNGFKSASFRMGNKLKLNLLVLLKAFCYADININIER